MAKLKACATFCALLIILFISSCRKPKELVYQNVQHFKVQHAGVKETIVSADVYLYNPNRYSLKLKSADVDVFLNDKHLGNISLDSLFTVPGRDTFFLPVSFAADMGSLLPDALQLLFNSEITLKIKGFVKAGKHGIYVSVPVNYEGKQDVMSWMK